MFINYAKYVLFYNFQDIVTVKIWPLMLQIKNNIILNSSNLSDDVIGKLTEVFTLCCSQIKKCVIQLFETFKSENAHKVILQVCLSYFYCILIILRRASEGT